MRKRLGQSSAGLGLAEQHVRDRIAGFLTGIPGLHHRRDLIEPGHCDGAAALKHDHGVFVCRGDPRDQFVLSMRKVDISPVQAFAVPFPVAADEQQRSLRASGQRDRPPDRLVADDWAEPEAQNTQIVLLRASGDLRSTTISYVSSGIHPHDRREPRRSRPRIFVAGAEIPGVNGQPSVDVQARGTGCDQTELIVARFLWPLS